jgi:hypothetical protein
LHKANPDGVPDLFAKNIESRHHYVRERPKNKLVEPSRSCLSRPDLLNSLKDASMEEFNVNLAWRRDQL